MVKIEQLAQAALNRESLQLRSLAQDLLRENPRLSDTPRPGTDDPRLLAVAASLIELFALRLHQRPPAWAQEIGPLPEPVFLLEAAETLKRLRVLCETQAPEPLRKRGLYAPPTFLEFA
jgi:predicted secreted protein